MELTALGAAASLSQLLGLLRTGIEVCKSVWDAPKEIKQAVNQYSLLCSEATLFLRRFERARNAGPVSVEDAHLLKCYTENARIALDEIKTEFALELRSPSFWNRIRWGTLGKPRINLLLTRMTRIETSILLVLQLVQLNLTLAGTCCNNQSHHPRLEPFEPHQQSNKCHNDGSPSSLLPANSTDNDESHCCSTCLLKKSKILKRELRKVQAHAISTMDGTEPQPTSQARYLDLALQNGLSGMSMRKNDDSARNTRICPVSHDAEIMSASRAGDAARMLRLIQTQRGIQHSRTAGNMTPLCFATQSGNIAAIKVILDHGVHIDCSFGKLNSTSFCAALISRRPEVVKFLVDRGASYTHRTILGWSPICYLWMKEQQHPPTSEILTFLKARSDFARLHEGVFDVSGWGVMHRVGAYGAPEDVAQLISYGLDPLQFMNITRRKGRKSCHSNWSVLHIAVYYGRLETCKILLPYYLRTYGVDMPDSRGWTLLHIAVERGHLAIVSLLIKHGANVRARTEPTLSGIPNDTTGYRYTPLSLAREAGPEYRRQVRALIKSARKEDSNRGTVK